MTINKTFATPENIPGIGGKKKGGALFGKPSHDAIGSVGGPKTATLKGTPFTGGRDAVKKLIGDKRTPGITWDK